jgi:hypothetical protein
MEPSALTKLLTDDLTLALLWFAVIASMGIARLEIASRTSRILFYLVLGAIVIRFCWWGDL